MTRANPQIFVLARVSATKRIPVPRSIRTSETETYFRCSKFKPMLYGQAESVYKTSAVTEYLLFTGNRMKFVNLIII